MPTFISQILKKKNFLVFALLFLVIVGVSAPNFASAAWADTHWWEYAIPGWNTYKIGANVAESVKDTVKEGAEAVVGFTISAMIIVAAVILIGIFGTLSNLAGGLLLWIIAKGTSDPTWSFTHFTNPVIAVGWTEVRDLANMVVVLGFIVIGIATALRFKDYEAKKLLPKLIVAALLINFSLLICGIIIDASNITTTHFLKSGGFLQKSVKDVLLDQIDSVWQTSSFTSVEQILPMFGITVGIVFFDIITMVVFFLFFFLFLFRYFALWILVILSPLAFVLYVFPFTKKFFDMWWSNFLQWCIIGIFGSFFLYLADRLTTGLVAAAGTNSASMMSYLVPSVFLIAGFIFSVQSSAMGASAVSGAFKKYGKATAKGIGGAAVELSGRNERVAKSREWMANKWAGAQEATGFAGRGYQAQQKQARAKKAGEQIEAMANAPLGTRDNNRYQQLVKNGTGAMGAAAIAHANKNGQLGMILGYDPKQMSQRAAYAGGFGYVPKEFTDKNWQLAGEDEKLVDTKRKAMGLGTAPDDIAKAKSAVNAEYLSKNWGGMSTIERANVDLGDRKIFTEEHAKDLAFKHGSDLVDASRSLPTSGPGSAKRASNKTFLKDMIGSKIGSKGADLDPTKEIDAAIEKADDSGDINTARKLRETRQKINSL